MDQLAHPAEAVSAEPGPACWFLVQTKPRAEPTATRQLERQGYTVYYPRAARTKRSRGRWVEGVEPLFPRYVFLGLDPMLRSLGPVRSTLGVSDLVRFGEAFAVVPHAVIDGLRNRAEPGTGLHRLLEPPFAGGAPVRICSGPLGGLDGVFERYEGQDRVLILLDVLGRSARIRMPLDQVVRRAA